MIGIKLMQLLVWILLVVTNQTMSQAASSTTSQQNTTTYHFNYSDSPNHHRTESKDKDGTVQGSYTYVGQDGIKRITQYSIGPQGHEVAGIHEYPLQNPILVALRRAEPSSVPQPFPSIAPASAGIQQTLRTSSSIPRSLGMSPHYIPSVEELIKFTYQHNNDFIHPQHSNSVPDTTKKTHLF